MELEFLIGRCRPEKQDYLFRCPELHLLLVLNLISGIFLEMVHNHHVVGAVDFFLDRFSKVRVEPYIYIDPLICVIFNIADMVAKTLIAFLPS